MTTDYRAMCAELLEWAERTSSHYYKQADVIVRARALLAQSVAEGPTDEELEDLADVMNVSGDPVPAMRRALELWGRFTPQPLADSEAAGLAAELRHFIAGYQQMRGLDPEHVYSIHRGDAMEAHLRISRLSRTAELLERPTPQPVAEGPTDEEIMELMPQEMRDDLAAAARAMIGFDSPKVVGACRVILNRHAVDHARAVLAKWGNYQGILVSSPQPVAVSERLPGPEDCDEQGRCWWHGEGADMIGWTFDAEGASYYRAKFWLPANALPTPEANDQ